eukprot:scaffold215667_cov34-Tisochrysis_lutea.AAC.1
MQGHALFLTEDNGGPHVPPNPTRKFEHHWIMRQAAGARRVLSGLSVEELKQIPSEFRDLARVGAALDPSATARAPSRRTRTSGGLNAYNLAELPMPPWMEPAMKREGDNNHDE